MANNKKETDKDKSKRKLALQKKYGVRITTAKQGREAFLAKDYITATKKYNEYLGILAELNEVDDIFKISPSMFDNKKEVTEMLLISHIFWEIARINEMTPKLQKNFQQSLSQFVKFTINQPYQVLNAEMLRKYIKKNKNVSKQLPMFNDALNQIFVESKKCYIATMCFGETHEFTRVLRQFKSILNKHVIGVKFIDIYYRNSSIFVEVCENNQFLRLFSIIILKPLLSLFAKTLQLSIFK
jgi:hypothetical protein